MDRLTQSLGVWKQRLLAVFALCLGLPVFALDPQRDPSTYFIRGWRTQDGMPSDRTRSVVESRDGYLWVATSQGLARFDGKRFHVFDASTRSDLPTASFNTAIQDENDVLWFACNLGLFRYRDDRFESVDITEGKGSPYVRSIALTPENGLAVSTLAGPKFLRNGLLSSPGGIVAGNAEMHGYLARRDGSEWLATRTGLYRVADGRTTNVSAEKGWPNAIYYCVAEQSDGKLWIGSSEGGLRCLHPDGRSEVVGGTSGLGASRVQCLTFDRHGNLWIGTFGGLFRMTMATGEVRPVIYPNHFSVSGVAQIYEDREGSLWLATNSGLFQLRDSPFTAVGERQGLNLMGVYAVHEGRQTGCWLGTQGGGLFRLTAQGAQRVTAFSFSDVDWIYDIAEDKEGMLWIGTNSGIFRFDGKVVTDFLIRKDAGQWSQRLAADTETSLPGILHGRVNSLDVDREGSLWIGAHGGLYQKQGDAFRIHTAAAGLPGPNVWSVVCARDGSVWIVTRTDGPVAPESCVARLQNGKWTVFGAKEGLNAEYLKSLYEDSKGQIWVTTLRSGVWRYRNDTWKRYGQKDGLSHDGIAGVVEDTLGFIWLGTPKGLMRLHRSQFDDFDALLTSQLSPRLFTHNDGQPYTETNPISAPGMTLLRDGRIVVGTEDGAVVVQPALIEARDRAPPPVHIEEFSVNGKALAKDGSTRIPPGARDFQVRYSAPSLSAADRTRFRVRMDPLDTAWLDVGDRRELRYPRLPHGQYVFRVMASTTEGIWNGEAAQLAFTVEPFFYQRSWFWVANSALLGVLAWGVYRWRVRVIRRRADELERHNLELERRVAERTAALAERSAELTKSYEALRVSKYFYHSLVESLPQIIARKDGAGRYTYVNSAFGALVRQAPEAIIGKADRDLYPPEVAEKSREDDLRIMQTGQPMEHETIVEQEGGGKRYLHVRKVPLYDEEKRPIGVQVLSWDMTVFRETEEKLKDAQRELIETSRLAGIAEMATGVLHNIGNALNSVNTSADVVEQRIRELRVPSVGRVAQLLQEQKDRLLDFFTTDPRGAQLPNYLEKLTENLEGDCDDALDEISALQRGIEHIKEIVAAQQDHARVSAAAEEIQPSELIEYALNITRGVLSSQAINVVREFMPVPAVRVQRQKALQILVNLIRNAKDSVVAADLVQKQVTLGMRVSPAGAVQLYVTDNGGGIAAEDLTRIFGFGYTTKKDGHGFGLHSSALAAREMGGSLRAESPGRGKGATFIFELPAVPGALSFDEIETAAGVARG